MILETLYYLFKADTKDLKKGTAEAEKSTDGLKKSLKESTEFSNKLQTSFNGLANSIGGIIAAGLSASAIFSGLKNAADFSVQLSQQSQQLGVNISELNAWGNVMQRVGGDANTFGNDLQKLAQNYNTTPEGAIRLLPLLSNVFSKMNKLQAMSFGSAIGISPQMIQLLQQGNSGLQTLLEKQKAIGVLTEEDKNKFLEFKYNAIDMGNSLTYLFSKMVESALPAINLVLNGLTSFFSFVSHNQALVEGAFYGIAAAVTAFGIAFLIANPAMTLTAVIIGGIVSACAGLNWILSKLNSLSPGKIFEDIGSGASNSLGFLKNMQEIIDSIVSTVKEAVELFDQFANFQSDRSDALEAIKTSWSPGGYMHLATNTPLNNTSPSSISSSNSNVATNNTANINNKVNIHTQSSDPVAVKNAVESNMVDKIKTAINYFDSGRRS